MHPLAASYRVDGDSGEVFVGVHGFTGTPAHLRLLAAHIHQTHGHTVLLPRLEGHGTSMQHMASTGRRHWTASVRDAMRVAFELSDRVHLFGFSMGGLLSLQAASEFPVRTLTTLNTPMIDSKRRVLFARLAAPFAPFRMWEDSGDPPSGEALDYWIHYPGMPTGSIYELSELRRLAQEAAGAVTAPTLIIQSRVDETVPARSAGILAHELSNTQARVSWLSDSPHNALLYDERDLIHQAVSEHISGATRAD